MLSDEDFKQWCRELELPEQTKALIAHIRGSPPSRRVQSAAGNVSGRYPSQKMGVSIQFESHRLELAAIHEMEHDPDVLAYYDQPGRIKLTYQGKNNDRRVGAIHTPDFFVIRQKKAGWIECKMEDRLMELALDMPHRYVRGSDGTWSCPPGEAYAEPFGLFYQLYTSAQIDWIYQRNLLFLEDYLRVNAPAIPAEQTEAIYTAVMRNPGLTLCDLLEKHPTGWADALYFLIGTSGLYVDLHAAPLAEPDKVRVFLNRKMAQAHAVLTPVAPSVPRPHILQAPVGAPLLWDGKPWSILNIGLTLTTLRSEHNELVDVPHETFETLLQQGKITGLDIQPKDTRQQIQTRLAQATPADLQEANRRYALLGEWQRPDSNSATASVSTRTLQRWQRQYREAEITLGNGYLGLLPRANARGNRLKKLPEQAETLMEQFILNDYETLKQKPKQEVYLAFERQAKLEGLAIIPTYKTFWKRIKQRPAYEQALKRLGKRAATQLEPWVWELERTTPKHGDRPLEIGHLDHTELDVELVSARTGRPLGRPWASFLTDAFTRRLLAIYLTFDPPSYRSCMMLLRECVWRYGRLPQILVVDGGREFDSVYFETLTAYYGCTKKTRPWAHPRYGSVCERLFGTANSQFVHDLLGNTQIMQRVRQVTKKVQPKEQAVWTLGDLYDYLSIWAFEVYDLAEHPALLGQSPADAFQKGLSTTGERAHMRYDDDFRYLSLAGPRRSKKGTAKVEQGRGVKINYVYYSSKFFALPEVEGTNVLVRYDPFDIGVAFAFVQGNWVKCLSEYYLQFRGHTEREIQIASTELRKSQQNHGRGATVTAKRLADFLASAEAHEVVLTQRLHDLETRNVLARMGGYHMLPVEQDQTLFDDVLSSSLLPARDQSTDSVLEPVEPIQDNEEEDLENLDEYEEYR